MSGARPVRILRLIARLNTGGPAIHTILLTRALNDERYTSRLVTGVVSETEGDMEYYAERRNVVPIVIPELGRPVSIFDDVRAFVRIYRMIRAERPDIIHTHTAKAGTLGRVAGILHNVLCRLHRQPRARLVHTFHGHVFHDYFSAPVSHALVFVERVLALFTDRIIAVSDSIKHDLVARYRLCGERRVAVVALGLDFGWVAELDEASGRLRAAHGVAPDALTVGMVGRLTGIKNHGLFFAGLARTRAPKVAGLVIGDGGLRAELEAAATAAGLDGRVAFTGWQRDPARIYADLDIVCLTSRNEGTPVALIEAMAAGRPFVATRVGGVPDLMLGEAIRQPEGFEVFANGVLVPPDEPEMLAAAIDYLAARPDVRRAMGAIGQAHVLKRFSEERLVQDVEAVYREVLSGRHQETG
jgi:glycosyltransferase involved in cell wall biosynthesis